MEEEEWEGGEGRVRVLGTCSLKKGKGRMVLTSKSRRKEEKKKKRKTKARHVYIMLSENGYPFGRSCSLQ